MCRVKALGELAYRVALRHLRVSPNARSCSTLGSVSDPEGSSNTPLPDKGMGIFEADEAVLSKMRLTSYVWPFSTLSAIVNWASMRRRRRRRSRFENCGLVLCFLLARLSPAIPWSSPWSLCGSEEVPAPYLCSILMVQPRDSMSTGDAVIRPSRPSSRRDGVPDRTP